MLYALHDGNKVPAIKGQRLKDARCPQGCVEAPLGPHRADAFFDGAVIEFQNSPIAPEAIQARERFYGPGMLWVFNAQGWRVTLRRKRKPSGLPCGGLDPRLWRWDPVAQGWVPAEDAYEPGPYRSFRFRWPHRSLEAVRAAMVWDFGAAGLLHVKKVYWAGTVGGWGHLYSHESFMRQLRLNPVETPDPQ